MTNVKLALSGKAQIYCVHDREKRVVNTPDDVMRLKPPEVDLKEYSKMQFCPCCENVFASKTDVPELCWVCSGKLVHRPMADIPQPTGEFNG